MENENSSMEDAKKILDKINEDKELVEVENMIHDNKISFTHKEIKYRVRLLNFTEKLEFEELKLKRFGKLLQDKDVLLEKDLIRIYKERGFDIEDFDNQVKKIDSEMNDLKLKLGEALAKDEAEIIFKNYEDKIKELKEKRDIILIRKTNLLSMSLENQLLEYSSRVVTYLTLDHIVDGKWERKFKTLYEFINYEDEELLIKAGPGVLLYNIFNHGYIFVYKKISETEQISESSYNV